MLATQQKVRKGHAFPIGATVYPDGVNFSLYSKMATKVELLFFADADATEASDVFLLDKKQFTTGFYWHIFIPGIQSGQIYAYRVHGPYAPAEGHRFEPEKVLLDPYSKSVVVPKTYNRKQAGLEGRDNVAGAMKSVVVDTQNYDWEGDQFPRHPFPRTIIYELHVGGFTKHPNSGLAEEERGTYAGLIKKIPYLKGLGITAVELLPVFQFDVQDAPPDRINYWGYCPVSFFAPHRAYSSSQTPLGPIDEFRDMVKALHKAGIEVILDVVYNHTSEGNQWGPTFCYKGIGNQTYYILQEDQSAYADYSGTGNTFNANHSVVRRLIVDSLRYWVSEMHVDGFRFDLASILSRDEYGTPLKNPPILWEIETDPILAETKLIAEAWDAAGLYQVGSFIGNRWKEWNGSFRDDVRRFFRGDSHTVSQFASRILASPDLYGHKQQHPEASINFVTCHDGFTLNDLVSYNEKHNEANGEDNQDGLNENQSWNCGVEGPTTNLAIEQLRLQQIKNFFATTLLAYGTPMLLMGDEIRRTQHGNNNAYCQDNELSWFDWDAVQNHMGLIRFVKVLIAIRLNRDVSHEDPDLPLDEFLNQRLEWHGVHLNQPDWGDASHSIACTVWTYTGTFFLHLIFNAYHEDLTFALPSVEELGGKHWYRLIDTSLPSPQDISRYEDAEIVQGNSYLVKARSIVVVIEMP